MISRAVNVYAQPPMRGRTPVAGDESVDDCAILATLCGPFV